MSSPIILETFQKWQHHFLDRQKGLWRSRRETVHYRGGVFSPKRGKRKESKCWHFGGSVMGEPCPARVCSPTAQGESPRRDSLAPVCKKWAGCTCPCPPHYPTLSPRTVSVLFYWLSTLAFANKLLKLDIIRDNFQTKRNARRKCKNSEWTWKECQC